MKIAGAERRGRGLRVSLEPRRAKTRSSRPSARRIRKKFNEEPETYAAHAYDGMNMLIWAIQVAGLNRAKIRDVLAYRTQALAGRDRRHSVQPLPGRHRRGVPREVRRRQVEVLFAGRLGLA